MLQIFALALGLGETDLDETFRYPLNDITMQYYPVQDPNEQSSISPHADYGGKDYLPTSIFCHLVLVNIVTDHNFYARFHASLSRLDSFLCVA
jgi:hypothetical protein